ncbi:MAG: TIGR02099 family protein [Xanthomonadales bacterium]|nr:TIGR02099 family protein [Xanthomonadales bacterium]
MKPLYRLYRRSLSIFWTAATIVLVLLATLAGLAELLLPYTDKYQDEIETQLSELVGQPVHFDSISGSWDVTGPQFILRNLGIFPQSRQDSKPVLLIDQARVKFSLLDYLRPNRPFARFEVVGAELELLRDRQGVLKISGMYSEKPMEFSKALELLSAVEEIHLNDTGLAIVDEISGFRDKLTASSIEIQYRDKVFLARWQAVLGEKLEQSSLFPAESKAEKVDGRLSLRLSESKPQSLRVWAKSSINNPGQLLTLLPEEWRNTASGHLELETWLEWRAGEPLQAQGRVNASQLRWKMQSDNQLARLDELSANWRLRFENKQRWSLWLADVVALSDGESMFGSSLTMLLNPDDTTGFHLETEQLDLGFTQSLLMPLLQKFDLAAKFSGELKGKLNHLLLATDTAGDINWLELSAEDVQLANSTGLSTIGPLNLEANFQAGNGSVQLHGAEFEFSWEPIFSSSQRWSQFDCHLDFSARTETAWQVQTQLCELQNNDFKLGLQLGMLLPADSDDSPLVDAQVVLHQAQASSLKYYWPEKIMRKKGVSWLKKAFSAGEIRRGQIQVLGELDSFPFRQGGGVFSAILPVYDMRVDFHPDWPNLRHTDAIIHLEELRLLVDGSFSTNGISIKNASSVIDMRGRLKVTTDFRKNIDAAELLGYIHASPLEEIMGLDLNAFTVVGPVNVSGHLKFYFDGRKDWFDVNGQVDFLDALFELPDWQIKLDNIQGSLSWSEHGIIAEGIQIKLNEAAGVLQLRAGPVLAAGNILEANLKLKAPTETLLPGDLADQLVSPRYLQGETDWDISVLIEKKDQDGILPLSLDIRSELEGLSINLPAPLEKTAAEIWPTHIHMPIQGADRQLAIRMEGQLGFKLTLDESRSRVEAFRVLLGDDKVTEPRRGFFSLGGLTREFNLDGWLALLSGQEDSSSRMSLKLGDFSLEALKLGFLGAEIPDTRLKLTKSGDSYIADFSGPAIEGRLHLPGGERKALVADFEHLYLPVVDEPEDLEIGTDGEEKILELNPASLPPMHLYARAFSWGHLKLKETRIETYPLGNGLHIEHLEGTSGSVHLSASGDWLETIAGQNTSFNVNITAENFEEILQVFDFSAGITGSQSMVRFDLGWRGTPLDIDFKSLNGSMQLDLKGGSLKQANPGAGRLLSLVNLQALPRRLMLDFRDVFTEGFHFDSAKGSFQIENGVASTNDVKIKSPAADILISGSTDMQAREYNQLIRVRPGVGSALPVIGAIAGGPGGAAAGLALQGLFKKALGEATEAVYEVSGSWDDPQIKKIDKAPKNPRKSTNKSGNQNSKNSRIRKRTQ